jgi:hypothetical protein
VTVLAAAVGVVLIARPSGRFGQSSDSSVDGLAAKFVGTTVRCAIPTPERVDVAVGEFRLEELVAAITDQRTPATSIKLLMIIMHANGGRR